MKWRKSAAISCAVHSATNPMSRYLPSEKDQLFTLFHLSGRYFQAACIIEHENQDGQNFCENNRTKDQSICITLAR